MKNICLAITLLILLGTNACRNQEENEKFTGIRQINYGTSFGECLGYCQKSIAITPSEIVFLKKGWDLEGQLPDSSFQQNFTQTKWNALIGQIEVDTFLGLEPVIGCPDCADGGAEWVEIDYEGQLYKVTFEYNNAPGAMDPYIDILRDYMDIFD